MSTSCANCGYQQVPEGASFCPRCGKALTNSEEPEKTTHISVSTEVGSVSKGEVTGVDIGHLSGNATIESTVNQIEAKIIEGQYVDRQTITQNILVLGPEAIEQIVQKLAAMQGVDKQTIKEVNDRSIPKNISQQITEIVAAEQETASQGVEITAEAALRLGMLAVYNREYDTALDYFRKAVRSDPESMDANEAIAWLQQSRATGYLSDRQYDSAAACLAEARAAAGHTDPLDARALALRGYIAKSLAEIAELQQKQPDQDHFYEEAERSFEGAIKLDPGDPSAQNGLGNIFYARQDFEKAIEAHKRAVKLSPSYTAAYHDLALAYEAQMSRDSKEAAKWRQAAIKAWKKTYELAPEDPGFTADYILTIGKRIHWLETQSE